jgi:iron complex outermembrane recepter protein
MKSSCSDVTNELRSLNRHAWLLFAMALLCAGKAHAGTNAHFAIPPQSLSDALDRFSEQSGLQVVYDLRQLEGKRSQSLSGSMDTTAALERLLDGSGLTWRLPNRHTVVVLAPTSPASNEAEDTATAAAPHDAPSDLSLIEVTVDALRLLPNEMSSSAFGLAKPLLETPRAVSFISSEAIQLFGLSAVEDLSSIAPGVFTTTRYGVQGSVDVRNVPADTYFRGMKRLTLQGHGRSVLAAMDTIEVVRGPPSPIDGLGKIGGFTNVVPKSGRARMGGYLPQLQGFAQTVLGSFDQKEVSFGLGGPLSLGDKRGGFYSYALLEDSSSYVHEVPIRQKVFQTAFSIDNFIGPFRLEAGGDYQLSRTSGALLNRVTQDVIDRERYIRGEPLAVLDVNGNGHIGYLEYARASAVRGNLAPGNQPLLQQWAWPLDQNGAPLPLERFPKVGGIPESLYQQLIAGCASPANPSDCADPSGLLRAQGIGGPQPISGYVPAGFALDPRTVGYSTLDVRDAGAFERKIEAEFTVGFIDLIYDSNADFTLRNQLFLDRMDQLKVSEQPGGGKQDVMVLADKVTVTYRWPGMPQWLSVNSLGSLIFRTTRSTGRRYGGDFSSHRTDATSGLGLTANSSFVHPFDNADLYNDGAAWTSHYSTRYWEAGCGALLDIDLFERTNFLVGARVDGSEARNTDFAGTLNPTVGTALDPGEFRAFADTAQAWDSGTSWSASVSHELLPGVRPYVALSESSLTLDNNNNSMENAVIHAGHIGSAQLLEAGVKASLFGERLFLSTALYEQSRTDVIEADVAALFNVDVSSTRTRGWEAEIKWIASERLFLSLYGLAQESEILFSRGANILVDARTLGFVDVVDAAGNVIYPAEAFLYGGRAFLSLPTGMTQYREKQGNPAVQVGANAIYRLGNGLGLTASGNYLSSVYSGRLRRVELPAAHVIDVGLFWEADDWYVKLDVGNVLDERYFRARTGDTLGETHVQAMPERSWQLTLKYSF